MQRKASSDSKNDLVSSKFEGYAPSCLKIGARLKRQRVTRLELATSSLARRCSTTELHPRLTYESSRPTKPKNMLIRHTLQDQMRTRYKGEFQKVVESSYRHSSNGVYYARFESGSKEIRRSLRTTRSAPTQRARAFSYRKSGSEATETA